MASLKRTPSFSQSWISALNTSSLNWCCKCSLLRLMRSCSNELRSKLSKPLMSKMPSKRSELASSRSRAGSSDSVPTDLVDNCSFIRWMSHSNKCRYSMRASPSRTARACSSLNGVMVTSLPVATFRHSKHRASSWASTPRSSAARCNGAVSSNFSSSSQGRNSQFPSVRAPKTTRKICNCSASSKPNATSAWRSSWKHFTSSTPGATRSLLRKYLYWPTSLSRNSLRRGDSRACKSWKKMW
mmetsp:Transcript_225/g.493  ORF Transcript_225/g.493 Transcript_225/m.493 type:complete len:242 (-) Transcript_225:692-1417(-)